VSEKDTLKNQAALDIMQLKQSYEAQIQELDNKIQQL
jgi:hypothetical protein